MAASDEQLSPEELNDLLSSFMPEIPGYRVLRRIGRGGMSYVYLGVQESLDRQVAIKVMAPEALTDEISKQRFEQEARTIAKLEHPCIVGIYEVGRTEQGLLFYVLPYLAKGHLGQRDFSRDEGRVVEVLRALLSALEYAHARGIVHRDVKAENVLFDNADRPLLTDFGIALSKRDSTRITTTGLAVGSGGYMAPEQARGEAVDGRADLYSVGVLTYELLTGRLPFQHPDALALALMHAQDPVPRLPPEKKHWQAFIDRAMAKSPDHRFRNAQQMYAALNDIEASIRRSGRKIALPPLPSRWHKPALAGLGAALVVAAAVAFWPAPEPDGQPDFFTAEDAAARPRPTTDAAPPAATGTPPAETAPPAAATPPDAEPAAFAAIDSRVQITPLDYDPQQPGARELAAARRQIAKGQLSQPAGDNALESLRTARRLGAGTEEAGELGGRWLLAAQPHLRAAIGERRDPQARSLYQHADGLAGELALRQSPPWQQLQTALVASLRERLRADLQAADSRAFAASRSLAAELGLPASALEPEWSQAIARPKPGDRLRSGGGNLILVRLPEGATPGLAVMREEVRRDDYAAFAAGRSAPRCRNRTAPIALKKRSWDDPGFPQAGNHPVVCVSSLDALDYAEWLGRRDGHRYRLPTLAEWRLFADYRAAADACAAGRIACGSEGTVAASEGPNSPLGLRGLHGNAKEWLSDCGSDCRKRLAAGPGWRDPPARAQPLASQSFDADGAFDDIGFRLVRDVSAEELELR